MFKFTIMTGHFASEASGPQKLQKYILRDLYASTFMMKRTINEEIIILLLQQVKIGD